MAELSSQQRDAIWKALDTLRRHHRAFQDTKWALQEGDLERIEAIAAKYQPEDLVVKNRFLFDDQMPDVGIPRSDDFSAYDSAIGQTRATAIRQIFEGEGLSGVHGLVDSTKEAFLVGWSLADSGVDIAEIDALADLDGENQHRVSFAFGYAKKRFNLEGLSWIDTILPQLSGRPVAQARVLRAANKFPDVWERSATLGKNVQSAYWREFVPIGLGTDFPFLNEVAHQLLANGRPGTATDMLAMYADRTDPPAKPELIADVLETLVGSPPEEQRLVSPYELQRLLEVLRGSNLDEDRLAGLEWQLLPGLGYGASAPALERRLARDPDFFVQVIAMCFKRADGTSEMQPRPEAAQNAYHLLNGWRIVPGSTERGGAVEEGTLTKWLDAASHRLSEFDRTEIGEIYIGHVFAHAKEDEDRTWPTQPVRNAIERLGRDTVERGFGIQIQNNRGGTSRGLTDGGKQERELAERFENWASLIRDRWPRTAAILRSVAEGYRAQGQAEDEEAERFKKGLDPYG